MMAISGFMTILNFCLQKVVGDTGILPVRRTGWKPVPPKAAGGTPALPGFS
jgi:hypothetical protein